MIDISQIRMDGGTQSRAAINDETVTDYAEAMADPDTVFPPIVVYFDGKDYWLADGFHRVEAWRRIGRVEVPAEVRQGDRRRAILHSVAANSAHGLRRTNADKRRAVATLLEDDEWSQWSDREIARRCAVSPSFVGSVRAGLSVHDGQIDGSRTVQRGGTTYEQKTENIGKKQDTPVRKSSDTAGADKAGISVGDIPADGPAPEAEPDPYAKLRREFRAMTPEAMEDDWIGLRTEVEEGRKRIASQRSEISDLKARIRDLSEGDQGATISRLHKKIVTLKDARDNAMQKAAKETRRASYFEVEAGKARKAVEAQEITL